MGWKWMEHLPEWVQVISRDHLLAVIVQNMVSFPYPLTIWWENVGTMWGIIAQHLRLYKHHFPYFLWSPNLIPYITSPMLPGIPCTIHQLDTGELSKTSNTWTSMNPECNHKLWNAMQALVGFFCVKKQAKLGWRKLQTNWNSVGRLN